MVDSLTKEKRSWNMSRIRNKDTKPELVVRSLLHRIGYRFRLHRKDLPGKPDIVLPKYKTVIFVNGCFWHRHKGCKYAYKPKSRINFWQKKFNGNIERHQKYKKKLKRQGWKVLVIWECQIKELKTLKNRLQKELQTR